MSQFRCNNCERPIKALNKFEYANLWCLCVKCFGKLPKTRKHGRKEIYRIIDKVRALALLEGKEPQWDDVPF